MRFHVFLFFKVKERMWHLRDLSPLLNLLRDVSYVMNGMAISYVVIFGSHIIRFAALKNFRALQTLVCFPVYERVFSRVELLRNKGEG